MSEGLDAEAQRRKDAKTTICFFRFAKKGIQHEDTKDTKGICFLTLHPSLTSCLRVEKMSGF